MFNTSERPASHTGQFTPTREGASSSHWLEDWAEPGVALDTRSIEKSLAFVKNQTQADRTIASRYTDRAVLALIPIINLVNFLIKMEGFKGNESWFGFQKYYNSFPDS
jgi:hypothetical protein